MQHYNDISADFLIMGWTVVSVREKNHNWSKQKISVDQHLGPDAVQQLVPLITRQVSALNIA